MADRAKLFKTGGSQAVRLPRKYRFAGAREVAIRRQGWAGVLEGCRVPYPADPPAAEPGPDLD